MRSDIDLPLPDGTGDRKFLEAVDQALSTIIHRANPDVVFYLSGAGPFEEDCLGRLHVSKEVLAIRDTLVIKRIIQRGMPVALVMGGWYARNIDDTVEIHFHSVKTAAQAISRPNGGIRTLNAPALDMATENNW